MEKIREGLSIGRLARSAGVGVETLRYYERRGLLPEPPRLRSGYRRYPPEAVARVRFIRRSQKLGFSLAEISSLLSLRVDSGRTCADVRGLARKKIAEIEEKIQDLDGMKTALESLARSCRGRGPAVECPILDHLDKEEETK